MSEEEVATTGSDANEGGPGAEGSTAPASGPENANAGAPERTEELERLKSENAERRVAAREAEERAGALQAKLFGYALKEATAGVLQDPDDFFLGDHEPIDFLAEDQTSYEVEKIREAAEALVKAKPHLAKRTGPTGDIGQGVREEAPKDANVKFAEMLKRSVAS